MIEPSVFHLSGRKHNEARHGEAWTGDFFFFFFFSFSPGYIFNDAKLLSSIAPLQSIASSSLQRCGRQAFPGETATAEGQNRLPRRLESNIRASLGLTGCDIRIAAGYTIQYNTRKWGVHYAAVGASGTDRPPGRDGLDLKTKNLHALVGARCGLSNIVRQAARFHTGKR